MQGALVSLPLSGLGRDALKVAAALLLAAVIAVAFAIASLGALLGAPPSAHSGRPPAQPVQVRAGSMGPAVVQLAGSQIGKPYVWGGASPTTSFDCSGLVQWAYRQIGIALPRTAQWQFDATARLAPGALAPGDLVFFRETYPSKEPITHVGIYVGGGLMVNAPTVGDTVREMPVFTGFWGAHYAGAGRVGR